MQIDEIFGTTIGVLGKNIDLRAKSQSLISSNIANAETPNYIPKTLDFEQELQSAVKNRGTGTPALTNPRHLPLKGASDRVQSVAGHVIETPVKTPGNDGNAVELESEMSKMLENQVKFNASIQMLSKKLSDLSIAIKGGN